MSKQTRRDFLKLAGAATATTLSGSALASENPFGIKHLKEGYEQVAAAAEGNCGEGKCGASMGMPGMAPPEPAPKPVAKSEEGKCGGNAAPAPKPVKDEEGKCGGRTE
ncbi:twin-arginine translocation signal domain-containing protein [Thiomicrorhabdus sp. ZW0627]|uniref:HvfA family oxazolone/thioamide-modified RiPP metallophore n=1 Tax=Thiomicrorhabdus sp. ZW0627 TaxID=3039774 RepID=UPI002436799B|nr:twin-arginine translocation signal domain-containing protein [Thiomicrorhabdus sp. ZW0627]MDG6774661.1 twin-arginine translocation signal domain-containing protein [Thiomicrorhabdus sp. ZW0627]